MGNIPAGKTVLDHADILSRICLFIEDQYVYRLREVCRRWCETVDNHRCVSTLVFPSALLQVNRSNEEAADHQEYLEHLGDWFPRPFWAATGEFVCRQNLRSEIQKSLVHSNSQYIAVARLGPEWEPYQISVPRWLVRGARAGRLKRIVYDVSPRADFAAIRCSICFLVFNEVLLQRKAADNRIQEIKQKRCGDSENRGANQQVPASSDRTDTPPPLMGLIDCLALWMHPAVFPRFEELHIQGDWEMKCPSQMYQAGAYKDSFGFHSPCWKEYAPIILRPLLSRNKRASCGLRRLRLEDQSGLLVAEVLFDVLNVEMPYLTHLEVDTFVGLRVFKRNWPGLSKVTLVQANCIHMELGNLPNLDTLSVPSDSDNSKFDDP